MTEDQHRIAILEAANDTLRERVIELESQIVALTAERGRVRLGKLCSDCGKAIALDGSCGCPGLEDK